MAEKIAFFKEVVEKILSSQEEIKHQFSVGERYLKIMKIITILGGALTLTAIGLILYYIFEVKMTIIISIIAFCLILLIGIARFYFGWYLKRANIYLVTNKRVVIHMGWLFVNLKSIDLQQITDIKIHQTFFDKLIFNTGVLKIDTAGQDIYASILHHIENPYKIKTVIIEAKHFLSEQK